MKLSIIEMVIPTKKNGYHPYLLRNAAFVFYTISIIIVNMLSGAFVTPAAAGAVSASELITLCNNERVAAGLTSLNANSKLTSAAHAKAANMFDVQYWDHFGPNGETPWQFILAAGYSYVYAGENLAKGFTTSEGVHSAWMASASHKENIMNSNYRDIGIAAVPGTLLGEDVILVVQMFGATSSLPQTSEPEDTAGAQEEPSTPQQTTPAPQIDDSLDITYPESGDILNSEDFMMEGTSGVSDQDLEIFNDTELLGDAVCDEGVWDFRPEDSWIDGDYSVHAEGGVAGISDAVDFTVDTVAPVIDEETLSVRYELGILVVKVSIEGDPSSVSMTIGDKNVELELNDDGVYEGSMLITAGDIKGECEIISSDESGNYSTLGIKEVLQEEVVTDVDDSLSISSMSDIFNKAVIIGLAILLFVDLFFLYRMKKVESQGKVLFKMGLWILILGVSFIVGSRGTIS